MEQRVLLEVTECAEEGIDLLAAHAQRSLGALTALLGVLLATEDLGTQVYLLKAFLVHAAVDGVQQHEGQVDEEDTARGELVEELVDEVVRLSEQEVAPIWNDIVAEELLVRVHPGAIESVDGRSSHQHLERALIGLGGVHGRLAIAVCNHESLAVVEEEERDKGQREHARNSSAKSETHKHDNHHVGVLVMQSELGA